MLDVQVPSVRRPDLPAHFECGTLLPKAASSGVSLSGGRGQTAMVDQLPQLKKLGL